MYNQQLIGFEKVLINQLQLQELKLNWTVSQILIDLLTAKVLYKLDYNQPSNFDNNLKNNHQLYKVVSGICNVIYIYIKGV